VDTPIDSQSRNEMRGRLMRGAGGVLSAVIAALLVTTITSVAYMSIAKTGREPNILLAAASGNRDAINVLLFVAIPSAAIAAAITALALAAVALPMYVRARGAFWTSLRAYVLMGLVTALVIIAAVATGHFLGAFLVDSDFKFAVVSLLTGGPIAMVAFWIVARPDRRS
jgi:hypothetical protein